MGEIDNYRRANASRRVSRNSGITRHRTGTTQYGDSGAHRQREFPVKDYSERPYRARSQNRRRNTALDTRRVARVDRHDRQIRDRHVAASSRSSRNSGNDSRFKWAAIVVAVIAALIIVPGFFNIFGSEEDNAGNADNMDNAVTSSADEVADIPAPNEEMLKSVLDEELASQMLEEAEGDDNLRWLAAYPETVDTDGEDAQYKLLKLAIDEPEAREFVRIYSDRYPASEASGDKSSQDNNGVPLFQQWDERWGYTKYSGAAFAQTGCAPTSFAMVYRGLIRNTDMTPYDMGQLAYDLGYVTEENGTDGRFFAAASEELGLTARETYVTELAIEEALDDGSLLIANVGPGDFTTGGHYLVITGIDDNGDLLINDPYSKVNSETSWPIDRVLDQTKRLYVFSEA